MFFKRFSFWVSIFVFFICILNLLGYDDKNIIIRFISPFFFSGHISYGFYLFDLIFWFFIGALIDLFFSRKRFWTKELYRQGFGFLLLLIFSLVLTEPGAKILKTELTKLNNDKFRVTQMFHENLAAVKIGYYWGYVKKNGEVAIYPTFDDADIFYAGYARVKVDGNTKYVDKNGKIYDELPSGFSYSNQINFSDELVPIIDNQNLKGYADKDGKTAIKPQFKEASRFSNGMAQIITVEGKNGFVNAEGTLILEPKFN